MARIRDSQYVCIQFRQKRSVKVDLLITFENRDHFSKVGQVFIRFDSGVKRRVFKDLPDAVFVLFETDRRRHIFATRLNHDFLIRLRVLTFEFVFVVLSDFCLIIRLVMILRRSSEIRGWNGRFCLAFADGRAGFLTKLFHVVSAFGVAIAVHLVVGKTQSVHFGTIGILISKPFISGDDETFNGALHRAGLLSMQSGELGETQILVPATLRSLSELLLILRRVASLLLILRRHLLLLITTLLLLVLRS